MIDNPWREGIINIIAGSNYLRTSEWDLLLSDLDRLYRIEVEYIELKQWIADERT